MRINMKYCGMEVGIESFDSPENLEFFTVERIYGDDAYESFGIFTEWTKAYDRAEALFFLNPEIIRSGDALGYVIFGWDETGISKTRLFEFLKY